MSDCRVRGGDVRPTGLSSGRLVKGSPVISSNPGTLGLLYDALYTLPDGRWTYLSEMRARMTSSGTSKLIIKVNGVDLELHSSQTPVSREVMGCQPQMFVQRSSLSKSSRETVKDPRL